MSIAQPCYFTAERHFLTINLQTVSNDQMKDLRYSVAKGITQLRFDMFLPKERIGASIT